MDTHSLLTSAVLQAAQHVDNLPVDLAVKLATLKARVDQEPSREPEDELAAELERLFGPLADQYADQIVLGRQPETQDSDNRLLVLLLLALLGATAASITQRAAALGITLSVTDINQVATRWAQQYTFDAVRGINNTTRQAISDAISTYTSTPGMDKADVVKLLEPVFGKRRAEMIATTEITRAYSQAAHITQMEMQQRGIETREQWVTWRDDRVCPICAPLHNSFDWQSSFVYGPPAHVNCRCWLALVRV